MGGLAAALLADVLGGLLLIVGGPGAIWRTLWVFWAQSAAAGIVAAFSLRSGMASLTDEAWLDYAAKSLDAMERRGPGEGETRQQFERNVAQRRQRLAGLAAIDRRTPDGAAAFAHARSTEGNLAGGIFGCAFVGFSIGHAVFLVMIWILTSLVMYGAAVFDVPFTSGDMVLPRPILGAPDLAELMPMLIVMVLVFAVGLSPLRRRAQMAEGEAAMKEALTRTFILQIVIIVGAVPALVLGSAPLAIAFVGVKTVADVYPLWRKRRAVSR